MGKIAYFLDVPAGLGGAGNVLLEQAAIMDGVYSVIVFIPCDDSGAPNEEYLRRCKKHDLEVRHLVYLTATRFQDVDILSALTFSKKVKEAALDENIILFHSVQLNVGVELAARELNIPHLMNIYQLSEEEFSPKYLDIYARYHSCDSILYCQRWSEMLNVESRCIRPAAPKDSICMKPKKNPGSLKLLMLGTVSERKNQLTAIQAVEECVKRGYDLKLSIGGFVQGSYAQSCIRYVEDNGLKEIVGFKGFVEDIESLLISHDCYLCSSIDESFPSSMVESLTYDLAVISTPVAGVPELMKRGYNAYITDGFELEDVVLGIKNYVCDVETGKVMEIRQNARLTWEQNFTRDVVGRQLDDYYRYLWIKYKMGGGQAFPRNIWNKIGGVYDKLYRTFPYQYETRGRYLYYSYLNTILYGGEAYIWGAGKYGKIALELLNSLWPKIKVVAFIDEKKIGLWEGIPIISPDEMGHKIDWVFIGFCEGRESAIRKLEAKGIRYNQKAWILP